METLKRYKILNALDLKLLAMALMFCDHLWATLLPSQQWLTNLGRLAFPIFAFQIAEGYFHTHDVKKYLKRLFFFALLSEIPFNLMTAGALINPFQQNVLFTFCLGILLFRFLDRMKEKSLMSWALSIPSAVVGGYLLGIEQKKEKPEPIMPEILYDMLAIIRDIGTEEPVNPLIKGCGYITGTEARLGEITLYVPLDTKKNFWGVDKDGYLMNVTGSSRRIYLKEAYRQRATAEAFNYPYYEDGNKEYYMKLTPTQSNCTINTEFPLRNTWEELTPLIILTGMGVIILTRFTKR